MSQTNDVSDTPLREELIVRAAKSHLESANAQSGTLAEKAYRDAGLIWSQLSTDFAILSILEATLTLQHRFPSSVYLPEMLFLTAEACCKQERYEQAIQFWQRVTAGYPDSTFSPQALLDIGKTYHRKLKRPHRALEVYQQCVVQHPETTVASEALLLTGTLLEEQEDYRTAFHMYYTAHLRTVQTGISDEALFHAIRIQHDYLHEAEKTHALMIEFGNTYPHSPYRKQIDAMESEPLESLPKP